MMGATHGLAGVAIGGALILAARGAGLAVSDVQAALVVTTSAIAAELPDLDLRTSRISRGSSTLTAVPVIGRLALLITLPVAIVGVLIRTLGADHRGPTHSPAAAIAWAIGVVPLYLAYFGALRALAGQLRDHRHDAAIPLAFLGDLAGQVHSGLGHVLAAWPAAAPLVAPTVLLAYLSHLFLDDLTGAPQALKWPSSSAKVSAISRPRIAVGGRREALLVALPLAALAAASLWALTADARPVTSRHRSPLHIKDRTRCVTPRSSPAVPSRAHLWPP